MIAQVVLVTVAGIGAVLLAGCLWVYNRLVRLRLESISAWAQIEVQLKRRHDLIANLVAIVQGYAAHEHQTLEHVTVARRQAVAAAGPRQQAQAENTLSGMLPRLLALGENYPQLKARTDFLALQEELAATENQISFARQYYNDTVLRYANHLQTFPNNLLGPLLGFSPRDYFRVDDGTVREAPEARY